MYPFAARLCCHVVFLSVFFRYFFVVFSQLFGRSLFFCLPKDLRHPPGCCSFSLVPSFRLLPVCSLKYLRRPPAFEIFHPFLPSIFFHLLEMLCVEYLIPDTGYMYEWRSFFFFFFCVLFCAFSVFCLPVRVYYTNITIRYALCSKGKIDGVTVNFKC